MTAPSSVYSDMAAHNAAKRLVVKAFKHQPSPIFALSDAFNLRLMAAARDHLLTGVADARLRIIQ